jgi:hypothetical protein
LYFAVVEARQKGDAKAEAKAQHRLDVAKAAARKVIAERIQ